MNYTCRIFIIKPSHSVWNAVFIALAFLVIFNGPVEAFSFPEGELLTYQCESNHPSALDTGTGAISHTHEIVTYRIDQAVELFSFVPVNGEPIANKEANETPYKSEGWILNYLLKILPHDSSAVEVLVRIAYRGLHVTSRGDDETDA